MPSRFSLKRLSWGSTKTSSSRRNSLTPSFVGRLSESSSPFFPLRIIPSRSSSTGSLLSLARSPKQSEPSCDPLPPSYEHAQAMPAIAEDLEEDNFAWGSPPRKSVKWWKL